MCLVTNTVYIICLATKTPYILCKVAKTVFIKCQITKTCHRINIHQPVNTGVITLTASQIQHTRLIKAGHQVNMVRHINIIRHHPHIEVTAK